ncbi:hypothetical protein, partial [Pseudomonas sp. 5Ae-yellow]|uniref:hypothetical protein n=1 Tax=Pseudomonas sp. 5Ae-yellow TaxID=2759848 RepID=UPI001C70D14D
CGKGAGCKTICVFCTHLALKIISRRSSAKNALFCGHILLPPSRSTAFYPHPRQPFSDKGWTSNR